MDGSSSSSFSSLSAAARGLQPSYGQYSHGGDLARDNNNSFGFTGRGINSCHSEDSSTTGANDVAVDITGLGRGGIKDSERLRRPSPREDSDKVNSS
jgi:hypothetical protein